MHFFTLFSLAQAVTAAPLIVPRGVDESESKFIVVMKTNAVSKTVQSTVARIASNTDYTYSNLFNGFSASLTKSELKDLLNNPNKNAPWGLARISNKLAGKDHTAYTYDKSAGEGTCTYVLDTGIEVEHPEFEGRARFVQNFVDNADLDANGHGTHIAGTIGSKTYGVAKKTQLFAVKVLNEYTAGQTSGILAGMDFIVEDAATRKCPRGIVVNMSVSVASSPAINAAARYIVKSGYFLAVAAGNDDTDASHVSPSNEPMACTVGATAQIDTRALFSNYGVSVDVFAPGVDIKSTSMTTPHVTGLAAYLLGLKDIKASELCNLIASMSLKDVIKGIPENTVNLLIQNGEAKNTSLTVRSDLTAVAGLGIGWVAGGCFKGV
ncbi:peptidase S8/S53 domain-containing protein [Fusarium redolens]|uniref:Peptidase S8/S53 domain-containing protein n=1 Tax=Fusarium redolens TaxID=48865 RepID=A0A9P9KGS1_FUSRE|nr:peptidase S8/S53 domain-containing protein [Fusarium redolens]KAH7260968.1 peptidase S8/S53 domain-containing protein [Fusarium redolens]